jgi:hypothetical protein
MQSSFCQYLYSTKRTPVDDIRVFPSPVHDSNDQTAHRYKKIKLRYINTKRNMQSCQGLSRWSSFVLAARMITFIL